MKSRWYNHIKKKVYAFNACYNVIASEYRSGHSDKDLLAMALEKYKSQCGTNFSCLHVWEILKEEPMFQPQMNEDFSSSKKARTSYAITYHESSTGAQYIEFNLNTNAVRPISNKAAKIKAKGKGKVSEGPKGEAFDDYYKRFDKYNELKQKDIKLKQKEIDAKAEERKIQEWNIVMQDTSCNVRFIVFS
ncbi:uncharacterized protein LOC127252801 [Andrographis paniculata]|uniref:uncharacterized protein LOC127252801 n=1 Tax=Andrographis paniculata TaxID=175694 RepID=UPI0021E94D9A|nr:uncharacterized protein LOC127252801 [Andrographis paniculata]